MGMLLLMVLISVASGVAGGIGLAKWNVHIRATPDVAKGRADDSQIQLEGAIPAQLGSNETLSLYSKDYVRTVERCYRGVTYVIFLYGTSSNGNVGGSAVILPDGKPLLCDTTK